MQKTIFTFLVAALLVGQLSAQAVYTICSTGCDFITIQAAVNAAVAGDRLVLVADIHTENNITINKTLTLCGNSPTNILQANSSSGTGNARIFNVNSGVTFTLNDLVLQNGRVTSNIMGGAINNAGTLRMTNCTVRNNEAHRGGAIVSTGTMLITNCTFSGNKVVDQGQNPAQGGALHLAGMTTIINSTFSGNSFSTARAGGRGGAINLFSGSLSLTYVTVAFNTITTSGAGTASGGGVGTSLGTTLNLTNTILSNSTINSTPNNLHVGGTNPVNITNIVPRVGIVNTCTGNCSIYIEGDPDLETTLQINQGGCTATHDLGAMSVAIQGATPLGAVTQDQRGVGRNAGLFSGDPDIGAVELAATAPACASSAECEVILLLPVELSEFTAVAQDQNTLLNWTTLSETNNREFIIERAAPEGYWQALAAVPGRGNSTETIDYRYIDRFPVAGINYYRLRQIDYDGAFEYSEVVAVEHAATQARVRITPNPIINEATLELNVAETDGLYLQLFNAHGQQVRLMPITDVRMTIYREGLATGLYHYRIGGAGQWIGQGKLVLID